MIREVQLTLRDSQLAVIIPQWRTTLLDFPVSLSDREYSHVNQSIIRIIAHKSSFLTPTTRTNKSRIALTMFKRYHSIAISRSNSSRLTSNETMETYFRTHFTVSRIKMKIRNQVHPKWQALLETMVANEP